MSEPRRNPLALRGNDLARELLRDRAPAHADQARARPPHGDAGVREAMVAVELCDHGRDRRPVLARPRRSGLLRDDARAGLAVPRGRRGADGPPAQGRGLAALARGALLRTHADQHRLLPRAEPRAGSGPRGSRHAGRHDRRARGGEIAPEGHPARLRLPEGDPGDPGPPAGRGGGGLPRHAHPPGLRLEPVRRHPLRAADALGRDLRLRHRGHAGAVRRDRLALDPRGDRS